MTKNILVMYRDNYADEFDVEGFTLFTEEQFNAYMVVVEHHFTTHGEAELYFGTNECMNYSSFSDYTDKLEKRSISKEESESILWTLGHTFGIFFDIRCFDYD